MTKILNTTINICNKTLCLIEGHKWIYWLRGRDCRRCGRSEKW